MSGLDNSAKSLIKEVTDMIPEASVEQLKRLEYKMEVEQALQGVTRNYEISEAATQILKAVRKELKKRGVEK